MSNGVSKVWNAEWYWDEDQPLQMQSVDLIYTTPRKTETFPLFFTDIKHMFENQLIEDWVFGVVDDKAKPRDVKELTMFFKHYLSIMESQGKVDLIVPDDSWVERELVATVNDGDGQEIKPLEEDSDEDQEPK